MKKILFTTGPVGVQDNVKYASYDYEDIGHRQQEFKDLFKRLQIKLNQFFRVSKNYTSMIFTGSGTSVMESVITGNIHEGNKILITSNGQFGRRFSEIASIYNISQIHLKQEWAEQIDLERVESLLKSDEKIEAITITHHETSVGILNPLKEIGELAKKYNKIFIVDAISSVGIEDINIEENNIDFLITSSAKAIQCQPVLGIICAKNSTIEKLKTVKKRNLYLNLYDHYVFAKKNQTPYTAAIPLFFSLEVALDNIEKEGFENRKKRYRDYCKKIRNKIKEMGLELNIKNDNSNSLSYVQIPKGRHFNEIYNSLRNDGFEVYPGKGELIGKVIHIGNIGDLTDELVDKFLISFEKVMAK